MLPSRHLWRDYLISMCVFYRHISVPLIKDVYVKPILVNESIGLMSLDIKRFILMIFIVSDRLGYDKEALCDFSSYKSRMLIINGTKKR